MTISLYAASVPVFQQMLNSLDDLLSKTEAHALANNIDADAYLQARLFPNMFPLLRQVQIAADFARGVCARLAGVEVLKIEDNQRTFAELHALIAQTLTFISAFAPEAINGQEGREIITRPGTPKEKRFNGQTYLLTYGLPQFFFHVTSTYAILRHNGIDIGKRDFMGAF